jgi:hypothetical protein
LLLKIFVFSRYTTDRGLPSCFEELQGYRALEDNRIPHKHNLLQLTHISMSPSYL